jgi:outer membrane protein TolC
MKNMIRYISAILLWLCTVVVCMAEGDKPRVLSLEECVSLARQNNVKARNAENDVKMAEELQKYARTKYYPSLTASAYHFEASDYLIKKNFFGPEVEQIIAAVNEELGTDFSTGRLEALKRGTAAGISFLEPLYTGGRITSINKLTDMQVEARKLLQDVTDDGLVQETEILYFLILRLHGKIRTLDSSDMEVASILRDATNLSTEGIVSSNDVLSVELMQDQLSALRLRLENARTLLRRTLAKAIGMPNEDIEIDTTFVTEVADPQTLWVPPSTAVDSRNESRLLDINVERSRAETKFTKASMLPIFAVGGSWSVSRLLSTTNTRGIAFATVIMPLSSFWSERHLLKHKKIAEEKALDFRQDKLELLDLETRDAYDNLSSSYRQVQIAQKSIRRADENLRAKREEYINGVTNMSVLLDAQRQQQQARDQLSDAMCDYHQSKTKYLIITGRKEHTYQK